MKFYSRSLAAGVLSAALLIAAAPAAQARSFDRHIVSQPASWFDAALTWLSAQLAGASEAPATRSLQTKSIPVSRPPAQPLTGSCIDPMGQPKPCGGAGTGGI